MGVDQRLYQPHIVKQCDKTANSGSWDCKASLVTHLISYFPSRKQRIMENNPEYNKSKVKIKIEYEVNKPLQNLEKRTKCLPYGGFIYGAAECSDKSLAFITATCGTQGKLS